MADGSYIGLERPTLRVVKHGLDEKPPEDPRVKAFAALMRERPRVNKIVGRLMMLCFTMLWLAFLIVFGAVAGFCALVLVFAAFFLAAIAGVSGLRPTRGP